MRDFWARVKIDGECWVWTGTRSHFGYGTVKFDGRVTLTHRLTYRLHVGPIPNGKHVLHHCDNPSCVRPSHLWLGTNAENVADKVRKERQARGVAIGRGHLTEDDVRSIRAEHAAGGTTYARIAVKYGVSKSAICFICERRNWKHVA